MPFFKGFIKKWSHISAAIWTVNQVLQLSELLTLGSFWWQPLIYLLAATSNFNVSFHQIIPAKEKEKFWNFAQSYLHDYESDDMASTSQVIQNLCYGSVIHYCIGMKLYNGTSGMVRGKVAHFVLSRIYIVVSKEADLVCRTVTFFNATAGF